MKRLVILAIGLFAFVTLLTGTALAGNHEWEHVPPHGHAMLQGAEIVAVFTAPDPVTGEPVEWGVVEYRKCQELAAGEPLRGPAHHHSVHRGTAGEALFHAGNPVLPLAPLTPWASCEDIPSPLVVPAPPAE